MDNQHQTMDIIINNQLIEVDNELAETIVLLNNINYKTSGCCIGNSNNKDYAWIKIQEIDELKILNLMSNLSIKGCEYLIEKELYLQKYHKVFVDYILKSPLVNKERRISIINNWNEALKKSIYHEKWDDYIYNTLDRVGR